MTEINKKTERDILEVFEHVRYFLDHLTPILQDEMFCDRYKFSDKNHMDCDGCPWARLVRGDQETWNECRMCELKELVDKVKI